MKNVEVWIVIARPALSANLDANPLSVEEFLIEDVVNGRGLDSPSTSKILALLRFADEEKRRSRYQCSNQQNGNDGIHRKRLTIGVNRRCRSGAVGGDEDSRMTEGGPVSRGNVRVERWVRHREPPE